MTSTLNIKIYKVLSVNGFYSKRVSVLVVDRPNEKSNVWIDLRLYFLDKPIEIGLILNVEEFNTLIKNLPIWLKNPIKTVDTKKPGRSLQCFQNNPTTYCLYQVKQNGKRKHFALTKDEIGELIKYVKVINDVIIDQEMYNLKVNE